MIAAILPKQSRGATQVRHQLAILVSLVTCLLPGLVHAGAWTLAEGDGQVIITTGRHATPATSLFRGTAHKDKSNVYVFVEFGVTDEFTVGTTASGEWLTTTSQLDLRLGGHARYRLWQGNAGDVLSLQLGGSGPVQGWFGDPMLGGTDDNVVEIDTGVLYGRGWVSDWGNSFVSLETGFKWRGDGRPDELRAEISSGHAISRRFMGLFGVYIAHPLGDGSDTSLKLAPSFAWTMWPRLGANDKKPANFSYPRTLQIGASYDVLQPDDGLGFYISVWNRF